MNKLSTSTEGFAQMNKAFRRMGAAISPFLKVVEDGDAFEVSWFQPHRGRELKEWFVERGYRPTQSSNRFYVDGVSQEDSILFKLTFGGDQ